MDYETKNLYSVTVMVHDGEDVHGNPDHSNDASLVAAIVVTDVDCDCVTDAVAMRTTTQDWVPTARRCWSRQLAGSASLNWSVGTEQPLEELRACGDADLRDMGLDGAMPPELNLLAGLERISMATS